MPTWNTVPNSDQWEWDSDPVDPGGAQSWQFDKAEGGIRLNPDGTEVYISCRNTVLGSTGELSKTFWESLS